MDDNKYCIECGTALMYLYTTEDTEMYVCPSCMADYSLEKEKNNSRSVLIEYEN